MRMYWMLFPRALPTPVELGTGGLPALAAVFTAAVPAWLLVRQLLSGCAERPAAPRLPVADDVAEVARRAA
jgi:hypothetical protein